MRKAATFSAAMHVTLLGAMYVGLPIFHEPEPIQSPPIIVVEFAAWAAVTNPPKPEVEPEPEKEPEPPKPEPPEPDVAYEPPPPPPEAQIAALPLEPEAEPEPEPEPPKPEKKPVLKPPEPEPEKKLVQKPPPKPKIRPRAVITPKPAVKKKKKKNFDANRIAALLDKSAKDKPKPAAAHNLDKIRERLEKSETPTPSTALRTDAPVTQGEYDRIKLHIIRHWNPNRGAPGAELMVVRVRIQMRRDGSLDGRPQIVEENAAGQSEQVFRAFADSAVRAVLRGNPLPVPLDKYESWREIEFTFSLKDMLG